MSCLTSLLFSNNNLSNFSNLSANIRLNIRLITITTTIDKFSLTSDANGTDVGDMLYNAQGAAGGKGPTHGYACGGETRLVHINKFSFSADGNAVDVADLTQGRTISSNSASSGTYCYQAGGYAYPVASRYEATIDKFVTFVLKTISFRSVILLDK